MRAKSANEYEPYLASQRPRNRVLPKITTHEMSVSPKMRRILAEIVPRGLAESTTDQPRGETLLPLRGKSYATSQPNLILSRLADADFRLIEADLCEVDLPVRKVLERPRRRIDSVYFPESGFASVVANGSGKKPIEVGIIGREGMTGLAVSFLGILICGWHGS